jgi:hypothetical protein
MDQIRPWLFIGAYRDTVFWGKQSNGKSAGSFNDTQCSYINSFQEEL